MAAKAFDAARKAASQIHELKGYVGVDIVLSIDDVWVIEINPRVTTSYVALRQVSRTNLATLLWDACRRNVLPEDIFFDGDVSIRKDIGCGSFRSSAFCPARSITYS
jgi:tyramine---L-glutamate ligase